MAEKFYTEDIEGLEGEIKAAESTASTLKCNILRHYLLNYILYVNTPEEERADVPVRAKLTELSVLLDKITQMEKKIQTVDTRRLVDRRVLRNKDDSEKSHKRSTPIEKNKKRAERVLHKTRAKEDPNICAGTKKSKKFR